MARPKKTKKAKAEQAEKPASSNLIVGDDQGRDVAEQAEAARGETENKPDLAGSAASEEARPPRTPEMIARDAQIEDRKAHLEEQGINPNQVGSGLKKVEPAETSKKQYIGMVTVTGVHGQTHEKISARIDLAMPSGEDYVHYAFFVHHPAASRDPSTITIDPTNTDDPMLRSSLE